MIIEQLFSKEYTLVLYWPSLQLIQYGMAASLIECFNLAIMCEHDAM